MMRHPVQPITLLATRAPGTAACRPRPWCCSSWQPYRTAVRLCSVQGHNSAKNISKYIETRTTLIARGCSPLEKGVRHHSAGMLFPRLSLHANTRARPNGHGGNDFSAARTSIKKPLRWRHPQGHGAWRYHGRFAPFNTESAGAEPPTGLRSYNWTYAIIQYMYTYMYMYMYMYM